MPCDNLILISSIYITAECKCGSTVDYFRPIEGEILPIEALPTSQIPNPNTQVLGALQDLVRIDPFYGRDHIAVNATTSQQFLLTSLKSPHFQGVISRPTSDVFLIWRGGDSHDRELMSLPAQFFL